MIQLHIFYSGNVQGVGFRYTVQRFATSFHLKGWVRNLSDGRVEILVEGASEDIDRLCREVEQYFVGYISNKQASLGLYEGSFQNFQIVH